MKKLILSVLLVAAVSFSANAQRMSKNALGLRFGLNNESNGFEISFQHKLAKANRLEVDLGWSDSHDNHYAYSSFKLTGLYQWVWKIDGGLNWYAGLGAGIGNYSYDHYYHDGKYYYGSANDSFATLDGDLGLEYNFDIPLQIALDLRPELYFGDDYHDNDLRGNVGLALRYRF